MREDDAGSLQCLNRSHDLPAPLLNRLGQRTPCSLQHLLQPGLPGFQFARRGQLNKPRIDLKGNPSAQSKGLAGLDGAAFGAGSQGGAHGYLLCKRPRRGSRLRLAERGQRRINILAEAGCGFAVPNQPNRAHRYVTKASPNCLLSNCRCAVSLKLDSEILPREKIKRVTEQLKTGS